MRQGIKENFGNLFLHNRLLMAVGVVVLLFLASVFVPVLFLVAQLVLFFIALGVIVDCIMLYSGKRGISGIRIVPPRLDLGDENEIKITIKSTYPWKMHLEMLHELPFQVQNRNAVYLTAVEGNAERVSSIIVKPLTRGEWEFGNLYAYASTSIAFFSRRFIVAYPVTAKVYPSFRQMQQYAYYIKAFSQVAMPGMRQVRKLGHSLEFEKIKDYVPGDDVRTINWKATARRSDLMVNIFTDTRQQQVYCIVDKGRSMKLPFEGMTLLDYSINATLALSNIILLKQDKAGLVTFSKQVDDVVPAERKSGQLHTIMETLYKQQTTDLLESDHEALWNAMRKRITQRSLIMLFTNFETLASLERKLPFLKLIAKHHIVCVIFFQNTMLEQIHSSQPDTIQGIYLKTIADQFSYEKRQIVMELRRHGIISVLTTPEQLSMDTINKYLELKALRAV